MNWINKLQQLKMPRKQRAAVTFLFSLGFFVTAAGIVRTYYIYQSLVIQYDQTWYAYPLWIAAAIEIDLGVVSSHTLLGTTTQRLCENLLPPRYAPLRPSSDPCSPA